MSAPETLDLLSAGPTDPDTAESALAAMYADVGLGTPEFIWTASPAAGFLRVSEELDGIGNLDAADRAVELLLSGRAGDTCFCSSCRAMAVAALIHGNYSAAGLSADRGRRALAGEGTMLRALQAELDSKLHDAVRPIRGVPLLSNLVVRPYGNPWITAAALGVPDPSRVVLGSGVHENCARLASAAGWWWPYVGFAVLSARPERLETMNGEIHCEDGPAVVYPDGWVVNAVRNVLLPATAFDAGGLSTKDITEEPNLEVRRVLLDLYGPDRFITDVEGILVDADHTGELWSLPFSTGPSVRASGQMRMVRVVDATPQQDGSYRVYWLHVPPSMRSAQEAVAWTFGFRPHEYRPEVET